MRFDGILTAWNSATDSGIITPGKGGDDIVVHRPAFLQDSIVPVVGEALSFQVELGLDGNKRAHNIARTRASSRFAARRADARSSSALMTAALVVLAASAALLYAAMRHDGRQAIPEPGAAADMTQAAGIPHEHRTDLVAASRFARPASAACDGRTRCKQMKSCEEAKYFTDNCPDTQMDGDGDGLPCEAQWCTTGDHASLQPPR